MKSRIPNPGTIIAVVALVLAVTGSAIALPGKNKVDANDIRKGAVKTKALKNAAVKSNKLADGSVTTTKLADGSVASAKIADNAVTGSKVADLALQPVELTNDYSAPGGELTHAQYGIDSEGVVHLRGGAVKGDSQTEALGRLPEAARPEQTVFAAGTCVTLGDVTAAVVTISDSGSINVTASDAGDQDMCENLGFANIDGISFPAGT